MAKPKSLFFDQLVSEPKDVRQIFGQSGEKFHAMAKVGG